MEAGNRTSHFEQESCMSYAGVKPAMMVEGDGGGGGGGGGGATGRGKMALGAWYTGLSTNLELLEFADQFVDAGGAKIAPP